MERGGLALGAGQAGRGSGRAHGRRRLHPGAGCRAQRCEAGVPLMTTMQHGRAVTHQKYASHPMCRLGRWCSLVATRQSRLEAAALQPAASGHARGWLRRGGSGEGQPDGAAPAAAAPAGGAPSPAGHSSCAACVPACQCEQLEPLVLEPSLQLLPHRLYSTLGCGGRAAAGTGGSMAGGASSLDKSHTCRAAMAAGITKQAC